MLSKFNIPNEILNYIQGLKFELNNIGRSGDIVIIFENKYILKISTDKEKLKREKEKNDWLINYIPVNKTISYIENKSHAYYLKFYLDGESLIDKKYISNPILLIKLISKAFYILQQVDIKSCPFKSSDNEGIDFVHGDFCLPNILVKNEEIIGFIDLENAGIGDKWYDISWALWSLSYNLETNKYNKQLLKLLNLEFNEEKYNQYIPENYRK